MIRMRTCLHWNQISACDMHWHINMSFLLHVKDNLGRKHKVQISIPPSHCGSSQDQGPSMPSTMEDAAGFPLPPYLQVKQVSAGRGHKRPEIEVTRPRLYWWRSAQPVTRPGSPLHPHSSDVPTSTKISCLHPPPHGCPALPSTGRAMRH